jgi:hypothetical protein
MQAPMAAKRTWGGLQNRVPDVQLERMLAARVSSHMTWSMWADHQRKLGEPVLLHRLLALQAALLADFGDRSRALLSRRGAYLTLVPLTLRVICSELERSRMTWPVDNVLTLRMKVSIDGRKLRTHPNVAWFISFIESLDAQSNVGNYTFAVADMREPELAADGVWSEIGLNESLAFLRSGSLQLGLLAIVIDPFVCADWKCLTYTVGFAPANSCDTALACGWCHVDKAFLKSGWLKEYPFLAHHVDPQISVKEIPSLPIWRVRYCAMHGCNRLLDNHLRLLQSHGPKTAVKDVVRQVCPQWGKNGALHPLQMKQFFARHLDDEVVSLFARSNAAVMLPRREQPALQITLQDAARRLIGACKAYFEFAYIRSPQRADFATITNARDNVLAVDFALRSEMQPTTHYMTSHFVYFAEEDGGAYLTVQEGAEHHHKDDRKDSWTSFTCEGSRYDERNTHQMLLDTQELHRALIRRAGSV